MTRRAVLFVVSLLSLPVAAQIRYQPSMSDRTTVIVEFAGTPRALARGEVAASFYRGTFARLRADLAQIAVIPSGVEGSGGAGRASLATRPDPSTDARDDSVVTHEYSTVFFGAAVKVPHAAVARLRALPYVVAVHDDTPVEKFQGPVVHDAGARVNAVGHGSRGRGITIGILDTGVDYRHPALAANYGGGWDFVNNDADPMDDDGHGTHVAGIAAGNAADLQGVAPEATIVAYKVLNENGSGTTANIIAAIERAADPNGDGDPSDHLDVINLSLGARAGTADHPMARAIDNTVAAGVVAVIAAGNSGIIGTVGTPGTSRRAITVAAINTAGTDIALFSSRGPTPGLMTHKPDVSAPGQSIISARLGGGLVSLSGTSMASPHVAGAAAVLLALRPDWTPADVKSALITTAGLMVSDSFSRGSGRIDVGSALGATLHVSESGLSFGVMHATTGSRTESRTLTLTNRGNAMQTLNAAAADTPFGVTVAVTPVTLELAPGQSANVTVQLVTDNVRLRAPNLSTMGGNIVFSGTSSLVMPWAFVRGARGTIRHDAPSGSLLLAFGQESFRLPVPLDGPEAEMYTPANVAYDFVLLAPDAPARRIRLVSTTGTIRGDDEASLSTSSATLKIDLQARDSEGVRLAELPSATGRSVYYAVARVTGPAGQVSTAFDGLKEFLVSPLSERINIDPSEVYVDADGQRGYNANYARIRGVTQNITLTNDPYVHARLRARGPLSTCWFMGDTRSTAAGFTTGTCVSRPGKDELLFDLHTTPEVNDTFFTAIGFSGTGFASLPFRAHGGSIVASVETAPSPVAHRITHGSELTLGNGPYFPFQFPGTTGTIGPLLPPGFTGPFGEVRNDATAGAYLTLRDATGRVVARGAMDGALVLPPPAAGYRYEAVSGYFTVAGRHSRGVLEIAFAPTSSDLVPPTIGSMQLVGASGVPTDVLRAGEAATLRFAAADYAFASPGVVGAIASRAEATKAWFRVAGSEEWRPLAVTKLGSETGTRNELRHMGFGDSYSVDMKDATAVDDVAIDLRIEIEDVAGNHLTWTQEPAFVVGAPAKQGRRRAR